MVIKTRVSNFPATYFDRVDRHREDPVTSDQVFYTNFVSPMANSVTADYPEKRDWRFLIEDGQNATTYLSGVQNAFLANGHLFAGKEIFAPLDRSDANPFLRDPYYAYLRWHNKSAPTRHSIDQVTSYHCGLYGLGLQNYDLTSLVNAVDLQARQRFINNSIKIQRRFDALVFGGEIRETLHLVLSPGRAIREALNGHVADYVKKRILNGTKDFKTARRVIQERWLEFVFGIQPLISDVKSGAEALASYVVDRTPNVKCTSSAKVIFNDFPSTTYTSTFLNQDNIFHTNKNLLARHGVYVKYFGCVYNPNWAGGSSALPLFGLDWRNVVPALYELIPYSFLVDYFTNLGGLINYFSYGTSNIRWVARTIIRHEEYSWKTIDLFNTLDLVSNVAEDFHWSPGTNPYYVRRSVVRDNYTGSLFPGVQFGFPSLPQWLNIAALIDSSDKIFRGTLKGVRL